MIQVNIESNSIFYVTNNGLVFDKNRNLVLGDLDKKYNLRVLRYRDLNNKEKKIPFTRLIFLTLRPQIPIEGCTIVRQDKVNYNIENLICVPNKKMTKRNNLSSNLSVFDEKRKPFYNDFTLVQKVYFINSLKDRKHPVKFLASKYKVSETSIRRAIKRELVKN